MPAKKVRAAAECSVSCCSSPLAGDFIELIILNPAEAGVAPIVSISAVGTFKSFGRLPVFVSPFEWLRLIYS